MKSIRYILAAIAVLVLLGLSSTFSKTRMWTPRSAAVTNGRAISTELCKKGKSDDPPWDPGDESARAVSLRLSVPEFSVSFLLAKKDDTPWDPGDESGKGKRVEGRHG